MATVYLARLSGPMGFSRVVAIKRLHPHLLKNLEFKKMFLDEARLAARVRHPNVVPTLDVLVNDGELVLVMEYVHGESLLSLRQLGNQQSTRPPLEVAAAIMLNMLQGLHAAHEARDEGGTPLGIVHRDVSPQNVLLGSDGVARVLDFGVAKAMQFQNDTNRGVVKGKHSYMAPEVLMCQEATRRADVFAAATVFWELITGRKLFGGSTDPERMLKILAGGYPLPSSIVPSVPSVLDRIVMKGLEPNPKYRYATAMDMSVELEGAFAPASQRVVSDWVSRIAAESLQRRALLLQKAEVSQIDVIPVGGRLPRDLAQYGPSLHPALADDDADDDRREAPPLILLQGKVRLLVALAAVAIIALGLVLATRRLWASGQGDTSSTPRSAASLAATTGDLPPASPTPSAVATAATTAPSPEPEPSASAPIEAPPPASAAPSPSASATSAPTTARPSLPPPSRRPTRGPGHIKDFLPDEL